MYLLLSLVIWKIFLVPPLIKPIIYFYLDEENDDIISSKDEFSNVADVAAWAIEVVGGQGMKSSNHIQKKKKKSSNH